jgi:glycosyltransferase involved in cell wall biosynthesis
LFLSRLERDKGVWATIEAVEWLRRAHPEAPFRFVIAGDGSERAQLQDHARTTGLDPWVHFPGYVRGDEKYATFGNADLFLFPSCHGEGSPTAVIEALAAGLPIVYTPVGALDEILGPENGSRIEPDELSGERLGREIWSLYQDPARRQAMSTANQRLAHNFDVGTICAQMTQIYRHVVRLSEN